MCEYINIVITKKAKREFRKLKKRVGGKDDSDFLIELVVAYKLQQDLYDRQ